MMAMALGKLLGVWDVLTPVSVLGNTIPHKLQMEMAGRGMITIKKE